MLQVAVVEEGNAVPVVTSDIQHTVHGAAVDSVGPAMQQIADVDNIAVLNRGDGDPGSGFGVEDLKAGSMGLLEEEGYAAKVGMGASCSIVFGSVGHTSLVYLTFGFPRGCLYVMRNRLGQE